MTLSEADRKGGCTINWTVHGGVEKAFLDCIMSLQCTVRRQLRLLGNCAQVGHCNDRGWMVEVRGLLRLVVSCGQGCFGERF